MRWSRLEAEVSVAGRREAAAAYLRHVLGTVTDRPPGSLRFAAGPHGKPALAGGPEFSLAHSGALVMVAVSAQAPVGADVEQMRPGLTEVARFFSPAEQDRLAALPEPQRDLEFFALWTLKEAYRKATGEGIAAPGALLALPEAGWAHCRPALPAGYATAVAVLADAATFTVAEDAARPWSH